MAYNTTKLKVELTMSEVSHLLLLIEDSEWVWHVGNKEQYWKRSDKIKEKLNNAKPQTAPNTTENI